MQNMVPKSNRSEARFPVEERERYWKEKWRTEHRALRFLGAVAAIVGLLLSLWLGGIWLPAVCLLAVLLGHFALQKQMMAYVQRHLIENEPENAEKEVQK